MSEHSDHYICDNCEATFTVITSYRNSFVGFRYIDPTFEIFHGKCPACGCEYYSRDEAVNSYCFDDEG